MKLFAVCLFVSVILSGCATDPRATPEIIASTDIGPAPTDARDQITEWMHANLKDPASAQYEWGNPEKVSLDGGVKVIGWRIYVLVNAKNSYGGFTGFGRYGFYFAYGKLLGSQTAEEAKFGIWNAVKNG